MPSVAGEFSMKKWWNEWMCDNRSRQSHCSYNDHIIGEALASVAVSHSTQVCACQNHHLHGDFIWIIGREKRATPLLTLIYFFFFFCLIKLHVSLNLNCFLANLLMWSDLQFSVGMVLYYAEYQGKSDGATSFPKFALTLLIAYNIVQRIVGL